MIKASLFAGLFCLGVTACSPSSQSPAPAAPTTNVLQTLADATVNGTALTAETEADFAAQTGISTQTTAAAAQEEAANAASPNVAGAKPELLLTGDSWAQFMCWYGSFTATFIAHQTNAKVVGCDGATRFGGTAAQWMTYPAGAKMMAHLTSDPNIKAVYFSIGGNDFFSVWNTSLTAEQEAAAFQKIVDNVKGLCAQILKVRPDVKILVTGYDFGNFKDYSKIISAYKKMYAAMGNPTTPVVQNAVVRLSNAMATIADGKNIFYVQHYGLSHYYYGQEEYNLLPFKTKNPKYISPPSDPTAIGGNVNWEVSPYSLLRILFLQDAYHPNFLEFYNIAEHSYGQYLGGWFK